MIASGGCSPHSGKTERQYYKGVKLDATTVYVTTRRFEAHGLEWLKHSNQGIQLSADAPAAELQRSEVLILVHGYSAPDTVIAAYFHGLIDYLLHDGLYEFPIVVYDWPSKARRWEEISEAEREGFVAVLENAGLGNDRGGVHGLSPRIRWEQFQYVADKDRARSAGADGLIRLLSTLRAVNKSQAPRIKIIAHSMGSFVVFEALKKQSNVFTSVDQIVLLAPDLSRNIFEEVRVQSNLTKIPKVDVYYSHHDDTLKWLSTIANFRLPLGWKGPGHNNRLPSQVRIHDVTDALGRDNVHGKYLTREGARTLQLIRLISN